jgi:hypothetical protein
MKDMPKVFWWMIGAAVVAAVAVGVIIYKFDPYKSGVLVFALLFISWFVFLSCLTIPGAYFYDLKRRTLEVGDLFWPGLRRGLTISLTLTIVLILQTLHVLTWWNGLLVLLIAVIVDMYFRK